MGFFGGLIKSAVDLATLPVAVVADIVTIGQAGATEKVIEKGIEDAESIIDGDIL